MQTTLTSNTAGKNGGKKAVCAVTCVRLSQMGRSHYGTRRSALWRNIRLFQIAILCGVF